MVKQVFKSRLAFVFLIATIWALFSEASFAYNYAGNYTFAARWNEWGRSTSGGITLYPEEFTTGNEYDVCPPKQLSTMYPALVVAGDIKQTCANLWVALLESTYVIGNSITLTRAKDLSEDWNIDFIDPSDNTNNYWFNWFSNQYGGSVASWGNPTVARSGYPLTLTGGPHSGESIMSNGKLLALGDDRLVLLDNDGSISIYFYVNGSLDVNPTATTFTNGAWNGQTLASKLQYMVGYEEGYLYFVQGANTLHVYDQNLNWQRTDTVSLGNELSAYTLGDLIDNKIPGYTYIGWDVGPIVIGVTALRPLDHVEVTTPSSSGFVGTATTFTIKACATANCGTLYTRGLTGTLTLSDGTSSAFSIAAGASSTTVNLTVQSTQASGYVTVGDSGLSVTPIGSPQLYCGLGVAATSSTTCNYGMVSPLHHLNITASASSGITCTPTTFTITACGDATCSSHYTSGLTGNLTFSGTGATVKPSASIAFTMNSGAFSQTVDAQVAVVPATGYVTVGAGSLSLTPSGSPIVYCGWGTAASGSASACQFNVNTAGLLLSVPNHLSEAATTLTVTAVKQGTSTASCVPAFASVTKTIQLTCGYGNPSTGTLPVRVGGAAINASNNASAACGSANVSLAFNGTGAATATLQYADVGQMSLSGSYTGSGSDAGLSMTGNTTFVASPASFGFGSVTTSPLKAGSPFSTTLTARNSANAATPNFGKETPSTTDYVRVSWAKYSPTGTGSASGTFDGTGSSSSTPLGSSSFSNGAVTLSNLAWSEVGNGDLSAALVSSYLATGTGVTGSTGSTGAVGTFIPHHFDVAVTPSCGTFTYSGQPFTTTVTARNASGGTTANYDGTGNLTPKLAVKQVNLSAVTNASTGSLTGSSIAASSFALGVATTTLTPAFTFTNKLTSPTSVSIRAEDAAAVTVSSQSSGTEPLVDLRSGRIKMSNAFGSGKTTLAIPIQVQYWNGKTWVINNTDTCTTSVPLAAIALSNYLDSKGQSTSSWSTTVSSISISGGLGSLTLSVPSNSGTGSVDLAFNLGATATDQSCLASHPASTGANMSWLRAQNGSLNGCTGITTYDRDPSARATFGVYSPETKKLIFMQELY